MAYSEALAEKVRKALADIEQVEEKKMFGGLAFLVNEKMCINAGADRLMFRIDSDHSEDVLAKDGCEAVVMKGRVYRGYFNVNEDILGSEEEFNYWVGLALEFNKKAKKSNRKEKTTP
ncbi:MAG: TfoX/Sxy family protein [Chloroflexota bacterium]